VVVVGAVVGFVAALVGTWVVGIWQNQSAECDGVCVDTFPVIGAFAFVFGGLGALGAALIARALLARRAERR
jgi:hypothetical protein